MIQRAAAPCVQTPSPEVAFRVLVIADDDAVAKSTALLLRVGGHQTVLAPDSACACRRVLEADAPPQILLCDCYLDSIAHGIGAVRAVRATLGCELPAVLITGDTSTGELEAIRQLGACVVLRKPLDSEELLGLIECMSVGIPRPPHARAP